MTNEPPELDPYAAPRADVSGQPRLVMLVDMTEAEVGAYVGPNALAYWSAWRRDAVSVWSFNWAAALFSLSWLLYRKLFVEALVLLGGMAGLGVALRWLGRAGVDIPGSTGLMTELGVAVATGILGNGLYLQRTRAPIARARAQAPDEAQRTELLMQWGGTSRLWAAVGVLISLWALTRR